MVNLWFLIPHVEPVRSSLDRLKLGLRSLPTFADVLREKNLNARHFHQKILANYTSEESLITAFYDKNII